MTDFCLSEEDALNIKRRVQQKRKPLEDRSSFPSQVQSSEVRSSHVCLSRVNNTEYSNTASGAQLHSTLWSPLQSLSSSLDYLVPS